MLKILITGASGFVGGHLVRAAAKQSSLSVYAGVRKTSNTDFIKHCDIDYLYLDFDNEDLLRQQLVLHDFDYIILNAGLTQAKSEATLHKVNASYPLKVCKLLVEEGLNPSKIILISSMAAFGPADFQANQIVDQHSSPHPVTAYGRSKLQAEQFLDTFKSLNIVTLRPTAIYGPNEKDIFITIKSIAKGIEAIPGLQPMFLSFIYVKDLVKVILALCKSELSQRSYFVSDTELYPIETFNDLVKKHLNRKTLKFKLPVPIISVVARISVLIGKISGQYPILNPDKVNEIKARSWNVDSSPIWKDLNTSPDYKLNKGLTVTLDWYQENQWL